MYQSGARNYDDALYFLTNKYNQGEYGYGSNDEFIGSAADRYVNWVGEREQPVPVGGYNDAEFKRIALEVLSAMQYDVDYAKEIAGRYAYVLSPSQRDELLGYFN
jgi:hypothetical protein